MPDAERPGWLIVNTFIATPTQAFTGVFLRALGIPFWSRKLAPTTGP